MNYIVKNNVNTDPAMDFGWAITAIREGKCDE